MTTNQRTTAQNKDPYGLAHLTNLEQKLREAAGKAYANHREAKAVKLRALADEVGALERKVADVMMEHG